MNPSIDMGPDSPQMMGKTAKFELMEAEYIRALRRHAIRQHSTTPAPTPAPTPAAASPAPAPARGAAATEAAAPPPAAAQPPSKRRKSLLGAVAMQHATFIDLTQTPDGTESKIDAIVKSETAKLSAITLSIAKEVSPPPHGALSPAHQTAAPRLLCVCSRLCVCSDSAGHAAQVLRRRAPVQHACVLG